MRPRHAHRAAEARLACGRRHRARLARARRPAPRRTRSSSRHAPQRGATLQEQPRQVVLRFSESVEANFGALRVFDAAAKRVDDGRTVHPGGSGAELAVGLKPGLPDGTYVATYRVISADSHPVSGGLVFSIGAPGAAATPTVADLIGDTDAGPVTRDRLRRRARPDVPRHGAPARRPRVPARRLAAGAAHGRRRAGGLGRRSAGFRRAARAGCCSAAPRSASSPGSPGSSCRARPPAGRRVGPRSIRASSATCSARASARCGACGCSRSRCSAPRSRRCCAARGARAAPHPCWRASRWAPTGSPPRARRAARSRSPRCLRRSSRSRRRSVGTRARSRRSRCSLPLDVAHVLAMSAWIGGLVFLLVVLPAATRRLEPPDRSRLLAAALLRFSPLALGCVVVLLVTGTIQAIEHIAAWGQLLDTGFGRAVLDQGRAARSLLIAPRRGQPPPRHPALRALAESAAAPGAAGHLLRRTLRAEVALVLVVLGVTAALVSYPPPDSLAGGPFGGSARARPAAPRGDASTRRGSGPTSCISTCCERRRHAVRRHEGAHGHALAAGQGHRPAAADGARGGAGPLRRRHAPARPRRRLAAARRPAASRISTSTTRR